MQKTGQKFEDFVRVVEKLRRDCPWDRVQTFESIKPYMVEEVYEALQAIDENKFHKLAEELGDMLLHIVMLSVFASETNKFKIDDVIDSIAAKMIRRHPHVFGKARTKDQAAIWKRWEKIKQQEAKREGQKPKGILASIPPSLPALYRADKVQRRAARVGFDWDKVAGAWEKVHEELEEVHALLNVDLRTLKVERRIKEEIGDLLFAVTNVARKLNIDAEEALQQANNKFIRRFSQIEKKLKRKKLTLAQMDAIWNRTKAAEK